MNRSDFIALASVIIAIVALVASFIQARRQNRAIKLQMISQRLQIALSNYLTIFNNLDSSKIGEYFATIDKYSFLFENFESYKEFKKLLTYSSITDEMARPVLNACVKDVHNYIRSLMQELDKISSHQW